MKKILLILLVGLFQNFIFGATITSTGTGGNWNSTTSWVGGVIPGINDDVVIASGSTITVNANVSARSITISGTMTIPADTNVSINSLLIIVKSPSGNIYFNKKSIITLPQNVSLYLQNGSNSLNTSDNGVCSNNTEIHVGTTNYAVCTGGGATYTFDQVETAGGINTTITLSGYQYICTYGTNTTTFTSTVSSGTWSSGNTSVATVNASTGVVTAAGAGTATITYTVTGVGSATRDVYVASSPGGGVSAINGSNSQCQNTSANYTVTSNSANYDHTWSYSGTGVTFVKSADGRSATATFASNATSGQIVVNSINACGSSYGAGFNVTVAGAPAAPGTASPDSPLCTSFNAQWASTSLATKYFIDVATNSSFSTETLLPSYTNLDVGNVLVYPITGLNPGTTYYYRVRAYGNCGTSPSSATMTYATTPSPVVPVATSINPNNVQCIYAEPQWDIVANATGYYLDIATDSGFTNFVPGYNGFNVTGNNGIGQGRNLPAGTLYYRVRAYNDCIVTGNSNTVSFQTTAPVGGSVSPAQTICAGNSPTSNLTLSGYTTTNTAIVKWQKASDIGFTSNVSDISVTTNVLSIANIGVLTTSTYFRALVQNQFGSWCMTYSTPVLITVNNSISAASSTPTVCINTALTPITHTVIGFTGIGTVTGLPSGVTPSLSGNTLTISGTPTASGTFNYTIPLTGGSCGSGTGNATGTIIVRSVFTAGTISNTGETICSNTVPTVTIGSNTAASGGDNTIIYQWQYSTDNTFATGVTTINSNTATYKPTQSLTQTTYYRRQAKDGTCNTTFTSSVNIWTVTVSSNTLSVAPTGITGTTTICNGASTTLTVSGGTVGVGATVQWFTGSCGGTSAGTGNSITVSPTSNTTYYVRYNGTCNTTACASQLVTVNTPSVAPTAITGTTAICNGASTTLTVSGGTAGTGAIAEWFTGSCGVTSAGTGNSITVSPTSNTTYYVRYNGTCNTTVCASQLVTVNIPSVAPTGITGTTTICNGASTTLTVNGGTIGTGATVQWFTGSCGGPSAGTGNSITVSPTSNTTYYVRYSGACNTTTCATTTVTVNETPSAPIVGTITNISCTTNTGSVALSGLPSGNWTITSTPTTVATSGSGSSTTISGLAVGSYTFTVTNANSCPSPATATVTISDNSSTTWNGTSWSNGLPDAGKNVIITSVPTYTFAAGFTACALTINSGVVATVPSGVTLTITNAVTTNGQLIFENNASLVQVNSVANVGSISYKRISQPMKNFDYTYWSSPVAGQTFVALSPNTLSDKYMSYSGTGWVSEVPSSVMKSGIGYIIRVPKPNSTYPNGQDYWTGSNYSQPVEFKGVPNNGNITSSQTMVAGNFYLVGNPYPSAMDADEFLFTNLHNRAILGGTIYFWTHNTAITPTGTEYKYSSDDYASYNLTGGAGTAASSSGNKTIPDGYIASGQSFFASAELAGNVEFDNSMRVGGNNSMFFKPVKTSKSAKLERHRLWLNMINSGGAYKQALIGYIEGATNNFDKSFDGLSFDGNSYIDFYSVNAADNYVIQGRALPFTDTDIVPLGYRTTVAGDFTIAIDHADGNLTTQRVYLEDKQTGAINELTAGNYTFNTKAGTFNNRFVLKYTNKTLGTGDFETVEDTISILVQNKTVTIDSSTENIDKVFIYDITGKQLYTKEKVNNLQLTMQNLPFAQQVLLVKIFLENGTVTTKKVIFK